MPFLDDLLASSLQAQNQSLTYAAQTVGKQREGMAYSSFYNPIDTSAPAYIVPNAYYLSQTGYRSNEFAYSIMSLRSGAKAEALPRVMQYATDGGEDTEVFNHPLLQLLHNPNPAPNMTWQMFMSVKQILQDIAGFSAWEVEDSRGGDILGRWPMTPYFCSFLRGQQEPLRAIRYQPYGLPPVDIPFKDAQGRTKILFFSGGENYDPLSDRVRFRSPLMAALPEVEFDNAMTYFLTDFVKNGAKFAGMISVSQTIDESQAADYRRRWRAQHGGTENWADPLILGEGASYQSMQMNFRDMAFPELDARVESRICNAFRISPIVADAKAGLDISSYNNKAAAEKGWYYKWVIPSWREDADMLGTQMLGMYHDDPENYYVDFDFTDVYALKEDRDAQTKRAVDLYKSKIMKLNEARAELGLAPVEDGDSFDVTATPQPFGAPVTPVTPVTPVPPAMPDETDEVITLTDEAIAEAEKLESKKFIEFAKKRIKAGHREHLYDYQFKLISADKKAELFRMFDMDESGGLKGLADAINKANDVAPAPVINVTMPPITVNATMPETKASQVTVNVPAPNVTIENNVPVPSVSVVNEQPINITTPLATPKSRKAKIRKNTDGSFEVDEL